MIKTFLSLTVIGVVTGLLVGFVGGGADVLIVPLLLLFGIFSTFKKAVGTSLLMLAPPITAIAAYEYYKEGDVNVWYAIYLSITYVIATVISSYLAPMVNEAFMRRGYAIFLVVVAAMMWFSRPGHLTGMLKKLPDAGLRLATKRL